MTGTDTQPDGRVFSGGVMTYRVGIVGSGFGGTVHAPAYALHPQFELVAIASPNRTAASARGLVEGRSNLPEIGAAARHEVNHG